MAATSYNMPALNTFTQPPARFQQGQSSGFTRFFGNTLIGRGIRAQYTTTVNTAKSVVYLSPWGDLNPIDIANVRIRDTVLFGAGLFIGGVAIEELADATITPAVDSVMDFFIGGTTGTVTKLLVFQVVEQAIDEAHDEGRRVGRQVAGKGYWESKMVKSTRARQILIKIHTPYMNEIADVSLRGYADTEWWEMDIGKAWFLPYLECTGRSYRIKRSGRFDIAQVFGPALNGDWHLALTLLGSLSSIFPLSTKEDETPLPHRTKGHMLITMIGITPYRGLWSQSKCPSAAKIIFNLLDQAPGLVIPVRKDAPMVSWCGITVEEMRKQFQFSDGTSRDIDHWTKALYGFVETYIDKERVQKNWEERLQIGIEALLRSWTIDAPANGQWEQEVTLNRAGIVMLYY